jgi:hypothetical protein
MTKMTWPAITERALWTSIESALAVIAVESLLDVNMPILATVGATTLFSFAKSVAVQRLQVLGRIGTE